jgi:hypothetical protein
MEPGRAMTAAQRRQRNDGSATRDEAADVLLATAAVAGIGRDL